MWVGTFEDGERALGAVNQAILAQTFFAKHVQLRTIRITMNSSGLAFGAFGRLMLSRSIIFVFTLVFCLALPPAHGKNVPVWRAKMLSSLYGTCIVTVAENAAIFDTGIYKLVFNAPSYQTFSFVNDENSTYCVLQLKAYLQRNLPPSSYRWTGKKRLADVQLYGRPCHVYRLLGTNQVQSDLVVTSSMGVNHALEDAICQMFYIPTGLGLPLKIVSHTNSQKTGRVLLELVNLKQIEEPATDFEMTHSHKRVENQMQMLMTDTDGKSMKLDDIFEQPMDGKPNSPAQSQPAKKAPSK